MIPIVIQSFDLDALTSFGALSDLPLVLIFNDVRVPTDFAEVSQLVHGVGPKDTLLFVGEFLNAEWFWDVENKSPYSDFVDKMHKLDLSVHTYDLKEDELRFDKATSVEEGVSTVLDWWFD